MGVVQNSNYYMNSFELLTNIRTSIVYDSLWILSLRCAVCDAGVNLLLIPPKHVVGLTFYIYIYINMCKDFVL